MCMDKWQPIETAPKDGSCILVYLGGDVFQARWSYYMNKNGYWDMPFANLHGCGCCSEETDQPTKWMPLYEPPQE